jgi:glycosyltransferase involved in cell wall biosynthesis
MKLFFLSNCLLPSKSAESVFVMKMCQALTCWGHKVILLVPNRVDDAEKGVIDIYAYYGINNPFEILYIPWLKIKGHTFIYSWLAARKARKLGADLVYARDALGGYFSIFNGLRVILESHAPIADDGRLVEFFFKKIIRNSRFQKLVVITYSLKNYYEQYYPFLRGRIHVAPDGADPLPENTQAIVLSNKDRRMQIGYIGHLYKGKGMEVISQLAPLCLWADFHVVGGIEDDLNYWKEICVEVENIIFHGFVPNQQIYSFLLSFDVVLLPNQKKVCSYGGNERYDIGQWTSPMKAFEYMAARKPIIASDLPVLREIFEDGKNALLVPSDVIDLWKKGLERLRDNGELAHNIADNAYNAFIEKYTWTARVKDLI